MIINEYCQKSLNRITTTLRKMISPRQNHTDKLTSAILKYLGFIYIILMLAILYLTIQM